jgi:predicted SpoU family rRNA methylase
MSLLNYQNLFSDRDGGRWSTKETESALQGRRRWRRISRGIQHCMYSSMVTDTQEKFKTYHKFFLVQVLFAIGRDSCTEGIGLENVGVALNPK